MITLKAASMFKTIGDTLGLKTEIMTDEDIAWKYPHSLQHYSQTFRTHRSSTCININNYVLLFEIF